MLLVRGADGFLAPADTLDALARRTPRSRRVDLPAAGHMAFVDQPEAFLREVRAFLGEA